jgi:transcriptional regulator with XRE-family HTH domain
VALKQYVVGVWAHMITEEKRIIQVKDISLGDNIRHFRKKAGYKQTTLVKELQLHGCDISIYSYNRVEKGTQNPTVSLLLALCSILTCDMNDLFNLKK